MRRFSQRSHVVTLSEINVTPLLDLAFVLLIIFIITAPLLEQGLDINLPQGGSPHTKLDRENIRTIEINPAGSYFYGGEEMSFQAVAESLTRDATQNPSITVDIRADKMTPFEYIFQVTELCSSQRLQVSFRSVAPN